MAQALQALLAAYDSDDPVEAAALAVMREFARTLPAPLSRTQWPAHFTGSAMVVDPSGARLCLVLHAKLGRWLQPGGHPEAQDGGDLLQTVLREAREETGLDVAPHPSFPGVLDCDVHVIPARRDEPEHRHLDVRGLVLARNPEALVHDPNESHGARWLTFDEALALADEDSLRRLLRKARRIVEVR